MPLRSDRDHDRCEGPGPHEAVLPKRPESPLRVPASGASRSISSFRRAKDVDKVISDAVAAGGGVVKEAAASQWGGYFGYFSDPDGYLWKVASAS